MHPKESLHRIKSCKYARYFFTLCMLLLCWYLVYLGSSCQLFPREETRKVFPRLHHDRSCRFSETFLAANKLSFSKAVIIRNLNIKLPIHFITEALSNLIKTAILREFCSDKTVSKAQYAQTIEQNKSWSARPLRCASS